MYSVSVTVYSAVQDGLSVEYEELNINKYIGTVELSEQADD